MWERLIDCFVQRPERLIALGGALLRFGGLAAIVGLFGQVATTDATVIRSLGQVASTPTALAEIYPSLPTWWVPESGAGFALWTFIAIAGLILTHIGKQLQRAYQRL